jgi:hypothetical protein
MLIPCAYQRLHLRLENGGRLNQGSLIPCKALKLSRSLNVARSIAKRPRYCDAYRAMLRSDVAQCRATKRFNRRHREHCVLILNVTKIQSDKKNKKRSSTDQWRRASDLSCRSQVMFAQKRLGLNQRSGKMVHPVSRGLDYTASA